MKKNIILVATAAIGLAACGSFPHRPSDYTTTTAATEFDEKLRDEFNMATIVISATNHIGANYPVKNYATIYRADNPEIKYDLRLTNGMPEILMLAPGDYKITNFSYFGSTNAGNMHFSTSLELNDEFFANFSLAPNEIVYVGDLTASMRYGKRESGGLFSGRSTTQVATSISAVDKMDKIPVDIKEKAGGKIKTKLLKIERNTKGN